MFFYVLKRKKEKAQKSSKNETSKSNRTKLIVLTAVFLALLLCGILILVKLSYVPKKAYCEGVGEYSLEADTDALREVFFGQFGYTADIVNRQNAVIPCTGYELERYNELQKSQGLDLAPYIGRQVQVFTVKLGKKSIRGSELYGVTAVYKGSVIAVHLTDFCCPPQVWGLRDKCVLSVDAAQN